MNKKVTNQKNVKQLLSDKFLEQGFYAFATHQTRTGLGIRVRTAL